MASLLRSKKRRTSARKVKERRIGLGASHGAKVTVAKRLTAHASQGDFRKPDRMATIQIKPVASASLARLSPSPPNQANTLSPRNSANQLVLTHTGDGSCKSGSDPRE